MLEYTKTILEKVSFDRLLFQKELLKGLKWLQTEEARELLIWCNKRFGKQHHELFAKHIG